MTTENLLLKIEELETKLLDSYDLKPVVYIGYTETDKNTIVKLTREIEELTIEKQEKQEEIEQISNTITEKKETIRKIKGRFKCSGCNYTSSYRKDVVKHIEKQKTCSPEELRIIEIASDIICENCGKFYLIKVV